jgi:glycylpeptide N-tetradecanoyltransferase
MSARPDPYPLPAGFEWSICDMTDDKTACEVQKLLSDYYVEDPNATLRLSYTKESIQWALSGPGSRPDWIFGVRATESGKLLAFISGVAMKVRVNDDVIQMGEVNFLCVHPKLRHKKLAPLMIREITRRINLQEIWQAVYTGAVLRPDAIASARYWHRPIDIKKLVDIGFFPPLTTSLSTAVHLHRTKDVQETRPVTAADVPRVTQILNDNSANYKLAQVFSEEEVAHMFLGRKDIVQSFITEDGDFCSFYYLPSTIIGDAVHTEVRAAWGYYFVPGRLTMAQLINEAVGWAAKAGYDVFNILDVMGHTPQTLWETKFTPGTGDLHYYFFNWKIPKVLKQDQVGLVLP